MKVLITPRMQNWREVTEAQLAGLAEAGATEVIVTTDRSVEVEAIRDADVLIGVIDPELLERAGRLRWVQALSSGVDVMMFPEFIESDIILTSEKGTVGPHLADHAFALLLALTRSIATSIRLKSWTMGDRVAMRTKNVELSGLTLGIIGLGGTGTSVAQRAHGFAMRVLAIDAEEVERPAFVEEVRKPDWLIEMAAQCRVLAVCCPYTSATRHMIDGAVLNAMQPSSFIVNVTRGGIIHEDDLIAALNSGQIAGAGLDVTEEEPLPPEHPFWQMDNVVITPHIAGASQYREERVYQRVLRNLRHLAADEMLEGVIDKRKGY
jgi:phosphoglycerate dehydrogenase-like enzyme